MKLSNEFTVAADPDTVFKTLLDMEGVAGCLPGASVKKSESEENTFDGSMRVKIGPMTVTYNGSATLTEVDEQARRAVISMRAKEAKGQGTAMATITNTVQEHEGGTKVVAETDLHITGAQARFGRGVMEDVGARVLDEFSSRLERQITGEGSPNGAGAAEGGAETTAAPSGGAAGAPAGGTAPGAEPEALDMGAIVSQSAAGQAKKLAIPLAAIALLVLILLRRRR